MAGPGPGDPPPPGGDLLGLRGAAAGAPGVAGTLARLVRYADRRYGLSRLFETRLLDGRRGASIPLADVARSVFLMFAQRLPSLHSMEEVLRRRGRPMVREAAPSADTMGYAYARMATGGLRDVLAEVARVARRRKALRHRGPRVMTPWTVALDGHELFASYHRHCPQCLRRPVATAAGTRTQYYHRIVGAQLVDAEPPLCVDAEPIRPAEGEVVAARRMLERVVATLPWVRVFTADALYAEAPFLRHVLALKRAAIVVLKAEWRDLWKDVEGLAAATPARTAMVDGEEVLWWDFPGVRMGEGRDALVVRVVRTARRRRGRRRVAGEWVDYDETQLWTWVTVGLGPEIHALTIHRLGHARWDQENCGFNEQQRFFALDHCFRHDPVAILNFVLTLFLAAGLTELFFTRNIKDPLLRRLTLSGLTRLLLERPPKATDACLWAKPP